MGQFSGSELKKSSEIVEHTLMGVPRVTVLLTLFEEIRVPKHY